MPRLQYDSEQAVSVPKSTIDLLDQVTILENSPGSIINDAELLLEFIGPEGLPTAGKTCLLPISKLDELNARMTRPAPHGLKRPQQKSLPNLHGLYLILRASGLLRVEGSPPKAQLTLNPKFYTVWKSLNPTEKYFALLDAWLIDASPEIIGERGGMMHNYLTNLNWLIQKLEPTKTTIIDERRGALYGSDNMIVALMAMFGWIEFEYRQPEKGKGPQVRSIEMLPFGDAMVEVINHHWLNRAVEIEEGEDEDEELSLRSAYERFFPELKNGLPQEDWDQQNGRFTWKVSLGEVWRRIETSSDNDLDELAHTILSAFDFDNDHLYCFEMRDPRGRHLQIAHPLMDDAECWTDQVQLGALPLKAGDLMTFIFDFGDNWQFDVLLESVTDNPSPQKKRPKVIAKRGKAPKQYAYADEW